MNNLKQVTLSFALLATLTLITGQGSVAGELYKIVHPDGTVTYTDKAVKGAVKVNSKTLNTVTLPKLKAITAEPTDSNKKKKATKTKITWVSPAQDYTVTPGQQTLDLTIAVTPEHESAVIAFFYNGKVIKPPSASTSITVTNMVRGEATFTAKLIDNNTQKVIATSKPLTVHVKRAFIKHNQPQGV